MLHYDVIGFQSVEWLESFLHYCRKELDAEVDEDSGTVRIGGRTATAHAFPIGIDHGEFMALGGTATAQRAHDRLAGRSEEHTSELQSLMRNSYAVFCLKKKNTQRIDHTHTTKY